MASAAEPGKDWTASPLLRLNREPVLRWGPVSPGKKGTTGSGPGFPARSGLAHCPPPHGASLSLSHVPCPPAGARAVSLQFREESFPFLHRCLSILLPARALTEWLSLSPTESLLLPSLIILYFTIMLIPIKPSLGHREYNVYRAACFSFFCLPC